MLQQMWAKVNPRERFVAYGAGLAVIGWIVGMILGTKTYGGGSIAGYSVPGVSVNWFTAENAGLFAFLTLAAAVVTIVVLYLRVAPNVNFTWPMPYPQILLGVGVATLVLAVLVVLFQFTRGSIGDAPIFMWVADILIVAGGALEAWGAYQEWMLFKGQTPPSA